MATYLSLKLNPRIYQLFKALCVLNQVSISESSCLVIVRHISKKLDLQEDDLLKKLDLSTSNSRTVSHFLDNEVPKEYLLKKFGLAASETFGN